MKQADNRNQKLLILQAAIAGNAQPLRDMKAKQGRTYNDQELEGRRLYLTTLFGYEATPKETINFFGQYEPVAPMSCYLLPNGMPLYF